MRRDLSCFIFILVSVFPPPPLSVSPTLSLIPSPVARHYFCVRDVLCSGHGWHGAAVIIIIDPTREYPSVNRINPRTAADFFSSIASPAARAFSARKITALRFGLVEFKSSKSLGVCLFFFNSTDGIIYRHATRIG